MSGGRARTRRAAALQAQAAEKAKEPSESEEEENSGDKTILTPPRIMKLSIQLKRCDANRRINESN